MKVELSQEDIKSILHCMKPGLAHFLDRDKALFARLEVAMAKAAASKAGQLL